MEVKSDEKVADCSISLEEEHSQIEYMKELGTYATLPNSYIDDDLPLNLVCHSKREVIENEKIKNEKAAVLPEVSYQGERKNKMESVGNTDLFTEYHPHQELCVKVENLSPVATLEKVYKLKKRKRYYSIKAKLSMSPLSGNRYSKSKLKNNMAPVDAMEPKIKQKRKKQRQGDINKSNNKCKKGTGRIKGVRKITLDKKERSRYKDPKICTECDFSTFVPFQFVRHLDYHSRNEAHKCKRCTYSSHSKMTLWHHARYHHKKSYEQEMKTCEEGEKSTDIGSLENENVDKQGKSLKKTKMLSWGKCSICDFKTKHQRHLVSHMSHHSEIPEKWKCRCCNYSASTQGTVRHHTSFHHESLFQNPGIICTETTEKSEIMTAKNTGVELPKPHKTGRGSNDNKDNSFHYENHVENSGIICKETNEKREMDRGTEEPSVVEQPKSPKEGKDGNNFKDKSQSINCRETNDKSEMGMKNEEPSDVEASKSPKIGKNENIIKEYKDKNFHHENLFENPGIDCRKTKEKGELDMKKAEPEVMELSMSSNTGENENYICNDINRNKRKVKKVQRYGMEVNVDTINILDCKDDTGIQQKIQKVNTIIENNSVETIENQKKKSEVDLMGEEKNISPEVTDNLSCHKPAQNIAESDVLYKILTLGGTQSPNSNSTFLVPESVPKNVEKKQEQTAERDVLKSEVSSFVQNRDDKIKENILNSCKTSCKSPLNVTLQPKAKEQVMKNLYVCLKCPFQTSVKVESELHQENHFTQKGFSCMFCTYSDSSKEKIREHCKLHFRNNHQFECCFENQCDTLATKPKLTDLISLETNDSSSSKCRYCGISLPFLQLSKHEERHTEGCKYLYESHAKT